MADLKTQFVELTRKPYSEQAKWFLNGFWLEGADASVEDVWDFAHRFIKLDDGKKDGHELDEFKAHRFLESLGETLTVVKMREKLKQIDLDVNGRMALIEYLLFKYNKTVEAVVNSPQGDNREELAEAERKVAMVQEALDEVQKQLAEQKEALAAQKEAEAAAKQRQRESDAAAQAAKAAEAEARQSESIANEAAASAKDAEAQALAAEADVKAAVDDLKAQETAYANKMSDLDAKSKDTSTGQVARSKAAAELAQLKQENPLPLRKAKITQEAALRVLEKKRKEAEAAASKAEATANEAQSRANAAASSARDAESALRAAESAAADAESRRLESEESTRRVEEAVRETEEAFAEATRYFEEVKKKPGTPHGAIWWMQRELKEAQKYLPKKKQTM